MIDLPSDLEAYLKLNSEGLSISDIETLKIIFKIFGKDSFFEQVLNNCNIYLYRLGNREEVNNSLNKRGLIEKAISLGWINITLRHDIIFLLKIEE